MPWYLPILIVVASIAAVYGVLRLRVRRAEDVDPMVALGVGLFSGMLIFGVLEFVIWGPGTL